jgi:hypothetical protein
MGLPIAVGCVGWLDPPRRRRLRGAAAPGSGSMVAWRPAEAGGVVGVTRQGDNMVTVCAMSWFSYILHGPNMLNVLCQCTRSVSVLRLSMERPGGHELLLRSRQLAETRA